MDPQLSALVILRPPLALADEEITAEHAELLQPDPAAARAAQDFFRSAGFELGPLVALGFAVSGPRSLFEGIFGATLVVEGEGTTTTARTDAGSLEVPLDRLPATVGAVVRAVAFTPPPDFGPTGYGP